MTASSKNIGIVGSTGAVGEIALAILEERRFPFTELRLFSSERSVGHEQRVNGKIYRTQPLTDGCFDGLDYCIFSAGSEVSKAFAPKCAEAGCIVVDNTSAFRMQKDVPLVVPEVNPGDLALADKTKIVANPNCSTIQMVVALAPLHAQYELKRIIVSTYQSVSGAGRSAVNELSNQVTSLFNNREISAKTMPHQIAFNCIPQIDVFEDNGFSREEMKMINETRKILGVADLHVAATTVRVPTFSCHCESIYIETEDEPHIEEVHELLSRAPGVKVLGSEQKDYPLPFSTTGRDEVFVGRIRKDLNYNNGLHMWVVADNLRKGAALNAIQIIEHLTKQIH